MAQMNAAAARDVPRSRPPHTILARCSVNDDNIDMVKRRWFDAGRPMAPNWDDLLKGIRESPAK
eukprot:352199-Chlamydomonas_euryale.AAC.9